MKESTISSVETSKADKTVHQWTDRGGTDVVAQGAFIMRAGSYTWQGISKEYVGNKQNSSSKLKIAKRYGLPPRGRSAKQRRSSQCWSRMYTQQWGLCVGGGGGGALTVIAFHACSYLYGNIYM
jgi:hypothetical protein